MMERRQPGPWQRLLQQHLFVAATVGVSILNGSDASPLFDTASFCIYSFTKGLPLFNAAMFYYLTSLAVAVLTLLLAGIPAALYERWRGFERSTPFSLAMWLFAAVLLTLPTLTRLLDQDL